MSLQALLAAWRGARWDFSVPESQHLQKDVTESFMGLPPPAPLRKIFHQQRRPKKGEKAEGVSPEWPALLEAIVDQSS